MGTKKSEKFGEELLDIISSYCAKENIDPPDIVLPEKKKANKIIATES